MKPFKVKERGRKNNLLSYKNIAIGLVIFLLSILCYKIANKEENNNNILKEETQHVR